MTLTNGEKKMASVQDAIKAAQEAAAAMPTQTYASDGQGGALIEGYANPAGLATTFAKPSMATVEAATGVIPRNTPFLKVNEFGLRIGKNKEFITDPIKCSISMVEDKGFQVKHTLRFGNPATYLSTFDGQVCDKGGSWHDAIMKAKMADPNVEPYHSVDALITLQQDVKLKDETLKKGTQIAFNSSKTNFSEWTDFYSTVAEAGKVGQEVQVDVCFRAIEHGGNEWGVVTFEFSAD